MVGVKSFASVLLSLAVAFNGTVIGAGAVADVPTVDAALDPAAPDGDNGWYVSPVALSLSSDAGGADLQWREAGATVWTDWTAPVTFDDDGAYELEYRAVVTVAPPPSQIPVAVGGASNVFSPNAITVAQGGTVTYTNVSGVHNVVTVTPTAQQVAASPYLTAAGQTYVFTAAQAGEFYIYCEPHVTSRPNPQDPSTWTGMVGTLSVVDSSSGGEFISEIGEVDFQIDQTPPVTEASRDGDFDGDVAVGTVELSFTADDATSGVAETHWRFADAPEHEVYGGPLTFDEPGLYEIQYRSVDVAGNVEDWQGVSFSIVIEVDAVLDPAEPDGQAGWWVSPVTLTLSADNPEAELGWRFEGDEEWTAYAGPVVFDQEGEHEIEFAAWLPGGSAPLVPAGTVSVRIDLTPPQTEGELSGTQWGEVFVGEAVLALSATDATSGVAQTHWRVAGETDHEVYDAPVSFTDDGEHTVEYRSVDVAGNVEDWQTVDFEIGEADVEAVLDPAVPDGLAGWWVSPVTLSLLSNDPEAELSWRLEGDEQWTPYTGPVLFDQEGEYAVQFTLEGGGDVGREPIRIDPTPPQTEGGLSGEQWGDGSFYEEAMLTLSATDATSGVAQTHWRVAGETDHEVYDGPVSFTEPGEHTIEYRSVDVAGNLEDWQTVDFEIVVVEVDAALAPALPDGQAGWWISPVTLSLSANHPEIELAWRFEGDEEWIPYTEPVVFDQEGEHEIEFAGRHPGHSYPGGGSGAGGGAGKVSVPIDPTPPQTEAVLSGQRWEDLYVDAAVLTLSATDATSGVAQTHWRAAGETDHEVYGGPVTFTGDGAYTVEYRSVDVAGNTEDWQTVVFEILDGPLESVCPDHQGIVSFPDAPGSGHQFFIDCLASLGIVGGFTDGLYRPAAPVTRAQLASFVVRAIEEKTGETMPGGGELFSDVSPGSTHGRAIYKLRNAGIIQGYPDGTFRPTSDVTRQQTTRYVVNAIEWVYERPLPTSGARFPDVASGQFVVDIDKLATAGIIGGFGDGTFGPRRPVTRGQMARFIGNSLTHHGDGVPHFLWP